MKSVKKVVGEVGFEYLHTLNEENRNVFFIAYGMAPVCKCFSAEVALEVMRALEFYEECGPNTGSISLAEHERRVQVLTERNAELEAAISRIYDIVEEQT